MIQIVSPHMDDAALSIGGAILGFSSAGEMVRVFNVFTLSDWINPESISGIRPDMNEAFVTGLRKSEERKVAAASGYEAFFFDFPEMPLRKGMTDEEESALFKIIESRLTEELDGSYPIFFPFGIFHPDHVIVRKAACQLYEKGYEFLFYEDLPYATYDVYKYHTKYMEIASAGFQPICREIDVDSKLGVLKLYSSQVSPDWIKNIRNYSYSLRENKYYERYWKPDPGLTSICNRVSGLWDFNF